MRPQLAAETQAECLRGLERTDAIATAARASFLAAFTVGTGVLRRRGLQRAGLADAPDRDHPRRRRRHTAWAKRAGTHPTGGGGAGGRGPVGVLRAGDLPVDRPSSRRNTATSPTSCWSRPRRPGWGLTDLSALFAEMYERARSDLPDEDPDREFGDRGVQLETTFQGAGVMHRGPDPGVRRGGRPRCWTRCPPRPGTRMTGPGTSGTTTRYRRPCAGWSRPSCCRSGPGSR